MPELRRPVLLSGLLLALACAGSAAAQGSVGLGIGHSTRFNDTLFRGELALPAGTAEIVPNVEYVRHDGIRRYVTSLDVHLKLPWRLLERRLYFYVGTGLGLITEDPVGPDHSTSWDGQVNFIGGVAFEGAFVPYLQLRSDARKVNVTGGLRLVL
jgi:hypothetical protein